MEFYVFKFNGEVFGVLASSVEDAQHKLRNSYGSYEFPVENCTVYNEHTTMHISFWRNKSL